MGNGTIHRLTIGHLQSANYNVHGFGAMYLGFNCHQSALNTWTYGGAGSNGSALIWSNTGGELRFGTWDNPAGTNGTLDDATMYAKTRMRIQNNGKVVIGAPSTAVRDTSRFLLWVEGGIRTTEVQVDAKTAWPDYVFSDDYALPSLPEMGAYLRVHKHLPGFAPAAEVQANGIAVSETIRLQQEKIEELYLHVIALEKRLSELETKH